jgi:Uma2 family endonuclease
MEEYLLLEESPTVKFEYAAGQVYAMSGGTPAHGVYAANITRLLGNQLVGRPCRVQTSDVRIRIAVRDLTTYPDVSVVCAPVVLDPQDRNAVCNPCLLVEVLSPGTEDYDRGEKLASYQDIPSLREVVFVAHDARRIDVVRRGDDGTWSTIAAGPGETVKLALGCTLAVDDIYRDPTTTGP